MDKKKLPVVIALVVVALVALFWSLKSSFGIGETHPPTGPPPGAMQKYRAIERGQ